MTGALEMKIIFALNAKSLRNYRGKYLPKFYLNHPSTFKFILLLQSDGPKVTDGLGDFLKNVLPLYK